MAKLTIAYSTLASRIGNIQFPTTEHEILVLVQNQNGQEYSTQTSNGNKTVVAIPGIGVAKSRNHAVALANTEYLLFADDDVEFHCSQIGDAIALMEADPDCVLLLLSADDGRGSPRKNYPKNNRRLSKFNSARAATYEILIRVPKVLELGVKFDEDFGAGVENYLGDEYIFIADLIDQGAKCIFSPIFIASHPRNSSGLFWGSSNDRIARAKIFTRVFGRWAPAIRLAFGLRRFREIGVSNVLSFVFGR
jgi:GT2 family glycosyltransferase